MKSLSAKKLVAAALILLFLASCNTYKWQRKRYYKDEKSKNWNNYNPDKTKKEEDAVLKKYYRR